MFEDILDIIIPETGTLEVPSPELLMTYRELNNRTFWIPEEIHNLDNEIKLILHWNKEDSENEIPVEDRKPIRVFIDSSGGDIFATQSFISIVELSKTPIYTYNMGNAYSAAGYILIAGHKRFTLKNADVLIHQGTASMMGAVGAVLEGAKIVSNTEERMRDFVIDKTSITKNTLTRKKKDEWYIDSKESVELGIVDEIIDDISMITG